MNVNVITVVVLLGVIGLVAWKMYLDSKKQREDSKKEGEPKK